MYEDWCLLFEVIHHVNHQKPRVLIFTLFQVPHGTARSAHASGLVQEGTSERAPERVEGVGEEKGLEIGSQHW